MNQMRVSRGFYPVVAMVERQYTPGKGRSQSSSPKKGKGKKGRGKTKQGPITPSGNPKGSTSKARGSAAVGRQMCLRCGQAGHWARNCPTGGDNKRKADAEPDDSVMMVSPTTTKSPDSAEFLHDEDESEFTSDTAVQD